MTKWIDCLKEYNRNKRVWCTPRKGTRSYAKVMQCVSGDKNAFVKKKKFKIVEKFEDEKARDIQENPDLVVQMKRATINDVPDAVMNNIMGKFLNVKDKANFNQVSKNLNINYSKEEERRIILEKLLNWRIEYLVPYPKMPNKYKYDFFTEINKVLKKLTKISFGSSVSIQDEENLNITKHHRYNRYQVWKIKNEPEWNYIVLKKIKVKKDIPPKLMSEINYLLGRFTDAT